MDKKDDSYINDFLKTLGEMDFQSDRERAAFISNAIGSFSDDFPEEELSLEEACRKMMPAQANA